MDGSLKAAILIVSTTAAKDPSTDASATTLRDVFQDQGPGKWEISQTAIVSDDVLAIQRHITAIADGPDPVHLIVTTGGTGFAVADGTPEVCERCLTSIDPRLSSNLWTDEPNILAGGDSVAA